MKLFHNPASPFVRKVWVTLIETGQIDGVEIIPVVATATNPDAALTAYNPLNKIPCLVLDDGTALYDSRVICRYLDDRAGAGLYPQNEPWEVLTLEATADGIMEAALLMVYEGRIRPAEMVYAPWVEAQWSKVEQGLAAISNRWVGLLNGPMTMAHVAVGCVIGYLDFRHGGRDWRTANPALADWYAEFAQRESMQTTRPPES